MKKSIIILKQAALFLTAILWVCTPQNLCAKEVKIKTVILQVDDEFDFIETGNANYPFRAEKGDMMITLATPADIIKFSVSTVLESMDTVYFNLSNAKLLKKKSEWFFQWTKDYSTKYYQNPDGQRILTHTFYTHEYPYCLFARYDTDKEEQEILKIIDNMRFEQWFMYAIITSYKNASVFWILFMVLISAAGIVYMENKTTNTMKSYVKLILFSGIALLLTTGFDWLIFFAALIVAAFFFSIAYFFGIQLTTDD